MLESKDYDQVRAARDLGVDPDTLWEFINGPIYMRYIREQAHANMLRALDKAASETLKNISALVEIRDECGTDRERISAVRALHDIFKEFKLPPAPKEEPVVETLSKDDRAAAVERVREALRRSRTREAGQAAPGRIN